MSSEKNKVPDLLLQRMKELVNTDPVKIADGMIEAAKVAARGMSWDEAFANPDGYAAQFSISRMNSIHARPRQVGMNALIDEELSAMATSDPFILDTPGSMQSMPDYATEYWNRVNSGERFRTGGIVEPETMRLINYRHRLPVNHHRLFDERLLNEMANYTPTVMVKQVDTPIPEDLVGLSQIEIIKKLHAEVDAGPDRVLELANEILSKQSEEKLLIAPDPALKIKAQRMQDLGFSNTEECKTWNLAERKHKAEIEAQKSRKRIYDEAQDMAELATSYRYRYPFAKFLTTGIFKEICDKYKLVRAPSEAYIKTIPDNVLEILENSQEVFFSDMTDQYFKIDTSYRTEVKMTQGDIAKFISGIFIIDLEKDTVLSFIEKYRRAVDQQGVRFSNPLMAGAHNGFHIAAPADHFDLTGLKWDENGAYVKPLLTDDPIVFKHVKGGVLVFAKWYTEDDHSAGDPALLNPIEN